MEIKIQKMTLQQEAKARIKIMKEIVARMIRRDAQANCIAV